MPAPGSTGKSAGSGHSGHAQDDRDRNSGGASDRDALSRFRDMAGQTDDFMARAAAVNAARGADPLAGNPLGSLRDALFGAFGISNQPVAMPGEGPGGYVGGIRTSLNPQRFGATIGMGGGPLSLAGGASGKALQGAMKAIGAPSQFDIATTPASEAYGRVERRDKAGEKSEERGAVQRVAERAPTERQAVDSDTDLGLAILRRLMLENPYAMFG